ncbi:hypothetical protein [Streptomyces sp. NBC_00154]|uniref:hypothetical protein n=1 Tax=Streptomyces sp. NBC_00154 TaxID=2975670 RepID=UPI0022550DC0|nr:hypothetical protein [Streptomyces sp. NBC_00154]MCX5316023.1 hypothetical protein [Streptomyces sp. NBC_00154]
MHVEVYPAAARITHGSFVGAAGRKRNELSAWTRLRRRTLHVLAHDTLRDTVTISVPRDAAPGERYAVIWAQVRGNRGGGIALVSRTGIRMYLSVGGHNPPAPNFTARTMTAQRGPHGHAIVRAQIISTGGRALDLSGTLKLASVSGSLSAGPYQVQLGTSLAPHQSEPVMIPVTDEVADGPWRATLELRSGLLVKKFHAKIKFPHTHGMAPAAAVDAETSSGGALKGLVTGILLLGTALLIITNRIRRRHDRRVTTSRARLERAQILAWTSPIPPLGWAAVVLRFPRDAGNGDSRSDGSHERSPDDACSEEIPAGVA